MSWGVFGYCPRDQTWHAGRSETTYPKDVHWESAAPEREAIVVMEIIEIDDHGEPQKVTWPWPDNPNVLDPLS